MWVPWGHCWWTGLWTPDRLENATGDEGADGRDPNEPLDPDDQLLLEDIAEHIDDGKTGYTGKADIQVGQNKHPITVKSSSNVDLRPKMSWNSGLVEGSGYTFEENFLLNTVHVLDSCWQIGPSGLPEEIVSRLNELFDNRRDQISQSDSDTADADQTTDFNGRKPTQMCRTQMLHVFASQSELDFYKFCQEARLSQLQADKLLKTVTKVSTACSALFCLPIICVS